MYRVLLAFLALIPWTAAAQTWPADWQVRVTFECPTPVGGYDGYMKIGFYDFYGQQTYVTNVDTGSGAYCREQLPLLTQTRSVIADGQKVVAYCYKYQGSDGWALAGWVVYPYGRLTRLSQSEYTTKEQCYQQAQAFDAP